MDEAHVSVEQVVFVAVPSTRLQRTKLVHYACTDSVRTI